MTHLLLDYDDHRLPDDLLDRVGRMAYHLRWTIVSVRCDRTRNGWHVIIAVRQRVAFLSVVAAQAILGSDPKRELFNLQRARGWRYVPAEWRQRANVLYSRHIRRIPVWRR